jgi:hypothetical protein
MPSELMTIANARHSLAETGHATAAPVVTVPAR